MALQELAKDLELVAVEYGQGSQKATMTFLDQDKGIIREVNFNKQSYDNEKSTFIDDPEKAEKVEKWCQDYFNLTFDKLTEAIGQTKDIYVYDGFNSLFEVTQVDKFPKEWVGQIFTTQVESVEDTGQRISIKYTIEDKLLETKLQYSSYVENLKQWFVDPQKKEKQFAKFEERYGVPFSEKDKLVGKDVMVEVKLAFKKFPYGEIKKPNWK
ncbi:hypothetical protein [Aerococcus urinaeequi]|uniref:hypothetical protein n=1 Tax=Aerococcus urinaeequi TaxID=51665 RepID=UPI003B3AB24B